MKKILILIILFSLTIGGKVVWGQTAPGNIESLCGEVVDFLYKKVFLFLIYSPLRETELSLMKTGALNSCYLTFLMILKAKGEELSGVATAISTSDALKTTKNFFIWELLPKEKTIREEDGVIRYEGSRRRIPYNTLASTTTQFYNELERIVFNKLPPKLDNIEQDKKEYILRMSKSIVREEQSFALNTIIIRYINEFYNKLGQKKIDLKNIEKPIDELSNAANVFYRTATEVDPLSATLHSNMLNKGQIFIRVLKYPNSYTNTTTKEGFRQAAQETFQSMRELGSGLQQLYLLLETPADIKIETTTVPIRVIPPSIWNDKHEGTSSFAKLLPENIFTEIKKFIFKLAPPLFLLLLVVGGLYYLASPINIQNITTGTNYIKYAIIGYFLLLVITAVITAIKTIFGGP